MGIRHGLFQDRLGRTAGTLKRKIDITIAVYSGQQRQKQDTGNNLVMMDGRRGRTWKCRTATVNATRGFNAGKMKGIIILHNISNPSSLLTFVLSVQLFLYYVSAISLSFVSRAGANLRVTKRWPLQHDKDHNRQSLYCSILFSNNHPGYIRGKYERSILGDIIFLLFFSFQNFHVSEGIRIKYKEGGL
ncbi:hypothetical protein M441DRAFT_317719 [Trichoderma asperellum CBS 433.97]|uniref:Uncharacterized protein n=1 Tax=Trichoderma asperellum (strain ATCC 204424 / CBS 433.97 / NBRC 101777) TaxID=1042311 RepID=A0A2T3ZKX0_TRIA4|nr:hypothetical protein M441DRAFT_317719 [Trichoderma asperellum CBS 433.97]PTB45457.1 hypothetical protein M441DRAFT_317719 [Trichoderma asperellum CBS 433.97]